MNSGTVKDFFILSWREIPNMIEINKFELVSRTGREDNSPQIRLSLKRAQEQKKLQIQGTSPTPKTTQRLNKKNKENTPQGAESESMNFLLQKRTLLKDKNI